LPEKGKLAEEAKLSDRRTKEPVAKNADIAVLEEKIATHVGYPCSIGFNESSGSVKVSFKTNLDNFENLFSSLKQVDTDKVFDK